MYRSKTTPYNHPHSCFTRQLHQPEHCFGDKTKLCNKYEGQKMLLIIANFVIAWAGIDGNNVTLFLLLLSLSTLSSGATK